MIFRIYATEKDGIHQDELGNNGQEDDAMIENNEKVSTGFHLETYADACERPPKKKKEKLVKHDTRHEYINQTIHSYKAPSTSKIPPTQNFPPRHRHLDLAN